MSNRSNRFPGVSVSGTRWTRLEQRRDWQNHRCSCRQLVIFRIAAWGLRIAFMNYSPPAAPRKQWVGLGIFERSPRRGFLRALKNSDVQFPRSLIGFPVPILLALLLNQLLPQIQAHTDDPPPAFQRSSSPANPTRCSSRYPVAERGDEERQMIEKGPVLTEKNHWPPLTSMKYTGNTGAPSLPAAMTGIARNCTKPPWTAPAMRHPAGHQGHDERADPQPGQGDGFQLSDSAPRKRERAEYQYQLSISTKRAWRAGTSATRRPGNASWWGSCWCFLPTDSPNRWARAALYREEYGMCVNDAG